MFKLSIILSLSCIFSLQAMKSNGEIILAASGVVADALELLPLVDCASATGRELSQKFATQYSDSKELLKAIALAGILERQIVKEKKMRQRSLDSILDKLSSYNFFRIW